jgi:hypothetical protein
MTLTPSDVASLSREMSRWEIGEYISAGLVTIACAGEYIADFTDWFTGGVKERKERLAKRSTLLLIAALSFEVICLVRTNQLSGTVIGAVDELAENAAKTSAIAMMQSGQAKIDAKAAEETSGNALVLSRGARQEADSFEKDIMAAKKQSTSAIQASERNTEKLAYRTLSSEQQGRIKSRLAAWSGRDLDILVVNSTPEISGIADSIRASLPPSWHVRQWFASMGPSVAGILVSTRTGSDKEADDAAKALVELLKPVGASRGEQFGSGSPHWAIMGTAWDNNRIAPIRMLIGAKQ